MVDPRYADAFSAEPDPIFSRRGEPLSPETLRKIARRCEPHYTDAVRVRQQQRWAVLQGNLKPATTLKLHEQYKSDTAREGTAAHLTDALNPGQDIVHRVCQVYQHGITRKLVGVGKNKAKAFHQLYREAGIKSRGPDWNRIAYFEGPVFAIPQVRRGLMRCDTVVPHRRVVVLDEEDPTGWPIAVAYLAASGKVTIVELDRIRDYAIVPEGLQEVPGSGRDLSGLREDVSPFAGLRFDAPLDPTDWDSSRRHGRLVDGTIDVSAIAAVMGHVRKTQNKWLLFLAGFIDGMAMGQNLADPEKPILIRTTEGQTVSLQSITFDTPVTNFLDHIRFWYAAMAESTGVPAMISADGGQFDLEFAFDGLSELRDDQMAYAEAYEADLAVAMVLAAQDGRHPLWVASKLPTVEEVREGFRVEFGQMARRFADPQQQRDQADWDVRHGMINVTDLLRKRFPSADDESLLKQLRENLKINGEVWDMLAERNLGADASGKAITGAQQNGAKGPAARDGKVNESNVDQSAS